MEELRNLVYLIISDAEIITLDKNRRVIHNGSVVVENDRIVDLGQAGEIKSKYGLGGKVIDARGKVVAPGLINCHTHMFQSLLRGPGDDMELIGWLKNMLWPASKNLTPEHVAAGAALGCLEMIKTGVTCVIDHHHLCTSETSVDNIVKIMERAGLRGFVARGLKARQKRADMWNVPQHVFEYSLDEEIRLTEKLIRKWNNSVDGRVKVAPGPNSIFSTGPDILKASKEFSEKYELPMHIHIAESPSEVQSTQEDYGMREVEYLSHLGALNKRTQIVHGIWLSNREIALMSGASANHIHCPVSNMYLASGVAHIPEMLTAKINVALGTDGPASNNSHNMFEVLKMAALLHKVSSLNPAIIKADQVFEMATLGGARAVGLENEIGSLEKGKKADIMILDMKRNNSYPVHRTVSSIVYCSSDSNVDSLIVDGKIIMENRKVLTLDEDAVLGKAAEAAEELSLKACFKS